MSQPDARGAGSNRFFSRSLRGWEIARGTSAARWHVMTSPGLIDVSLSARIGPRFRLRSSNGGRIRVDRVYADRDLALISDGGRIEIADGCFFNSSCTVSSRDEVRIGAQTIFGENVKIYDHDHAYNSASLHDEYLTAPVSLGARCWFGSNVVILRGVQICDDVIVGANSVVSKSISSPGVYVGSGSLRRVK